MKISTTICQSCVLGLIGWFVTSPTLFAQTLATPEKPDTESEDQQQPELVGFELGDFMIKDYRPLRSEKIRILFTLHASTTEQDAKRFMRKLERNRMRVRDQVITAMRLADPTEFEDPDLRLIRRRLHLRLGRAVPDLPIEEIYFSDFRYLIE